MNSVAPAFAGSTRAATGNSALSPVDRVSEVISG